jgi:hypothetical protein
MQEPVDADQHGACFLKATIYSFALACQWPRPDLMERWAHRLEQVATAVSRTRKDDLSMAKRGKG